MQLNLEVERLDHFDRIAVEGPASADFAQHIVGFGVAYGLALQGLGMATVDVNLLPIASVRPQLWSKKTRWFAAAAAIACAAGGLMFTRGILDNGALGDVAVVNAAQLEVSAAKNFQSQLQSKAADVGSLAKNMNGLLEDREVWPFIVHDAVSAIATGNTADALADDFEALTTAAPAGATRMQTQLRQLSGEYKLKENGERVIEVTMEIEFSSPDREQHLDKTVCTWLDENARRDDAPYEIVNIRSNNNMIANLKVGADGVLAAESSAGDGAAPGGALAGGTQQPGARPPAGTQGGSRGNTGSGGSTSFGGVSGRRTQSGPQIQAPGIAFGGLGTAGGTGESGGTPEEGGAPGATGFNRGAGDQPSAGSIELDKVAPIPPRPGVYPANSTVYLGKVTFEVKLKGAVQAASGAAEGQ
jgi:hypothetical protein